MPKITIVLIAFIAAIIWVFIINGDKKAVTDSPQVTSEQATQ